MPNPRIHIVASRFNQLLVSQLVSGARAALSQHRLEPDGEHWVSGAFELPVLAAKLIKSNNCDAVIALGVVIRGDTPHFDYVCDGVTYGLMQLMTDQVVPIGYGVLMVNTLKQAEMRSSLKALTGEKGYSAVKGDSNKGFEAAEAVLGVLDCFKEIDK